MTTNRLIIRFRFTSEQTYTDTITALDNSLSLLGYNRIGQLVDTYHAEVLYSLGN